jgi:hypothetical protein
MPSSGKRLTLYKQMTVANIPMVKYFKKMFFQIVISRNMTSCGLVLEY